tara:strand:- start:267 stop:461 length:195 start_codon:yes stop_codon:yes gene_type:complete
MAIDFKNVTVTDMDWDSRQYPEFEDSFIISAEFKDTGLELNDEQLDEVNSDSSFVYEELQNFLY